MRFLGNSAELHSAIKRILQAPTAGERRVVLVAYVGARAEAFLPDPKGLEVICALEPGATSAAALVSLRDRGAKIRQSSGLHMKVYWSSRRGAIVCSANASSAALGRNGSKEVGVALSSGTIDIDQLIAYANPKPIRPYDLQRLAHISDQITAAQPRKLRRKLENDSPTLDRWLRTPGYKSWKIGAWWVDDVSLSAAAREESERYGVSEPGDYFGCEKGNLPTEGEWVLTFNGKTTKEARWTYVDRVVKIRRAEKAFDCNFRYQAIQINPSRDCPSPPFRLDAKARAILSRALKDYGSKRLDDEQRDLKPPTGLIRLLRKHMTDASV